MRGTSTFVACFGWRRLDDGSVRAMYWHDDAGRSGEFVLPDSVEDRIRKSNSIRGFRDKLLDEFKPHMVMADPLVVKFYQEVEAKQRERVLPRQ